MGERTMTGNVDVWGVSDEGAPVLEAHYEAGTTEASLPEAHRERLAGNYRLWGEPGPDDAMMQGVAAPPQPEPAHPASDDAEPSKITKAVLMEIAETAGVPLDKRDTRDEMIATLLDAGVSVPGEAVVVGAIPSED